MMKYVSSLALLVAVAAACSSAGSNGDTTAVAGSDRTVVAANVANAMAANPAGADSILKANGFTRETFEREMYDIAGDSARAAKYASIKKE